MALRVRRETIGAETRVDTTEIPAASRLVERLTGYPVPPNKAIVGANAFAHEAGIHQDGLLKDSATYQIIDPHELGMAMTLPLGKHSGRHAFARACAAAGMQLDREEIRSAFDRFKALADTGERVTLAEVFTEVAAS
jgi:2-isopropylmalate synthase